MESEPPINAPEKKRGALVKSIASITKQNPPAERFAVQLIARNKFSIETSFQNIRKWLTSSRLGFSSLIINFFPQNSIEET